MPVAPEEHAILIVIHPLPRLKDTSYLTMMLYWYLLVMLLPNLPKLGMPQYFDCNLLILPPESPQPMDGVCTAYDSLATV